MQEVFLQCTYHCSSPNLKRFCSLFFQKLRLCTKVATVVCLQRVITTTRVLTETKGKKKGDMRLQINLTNTVTDERSDSYSTKKMPKHEQPIVQ